MLLAGLEDAGFPYTDAIILTAQGDPFVQLGRETYVMTRHDWYTGSDLDLDNQTDMTLALQTLARFHHAARNLPLEQNFSASSLLSDVFVRDAAFIAKTAKQISKNSRMSDFDVLFIKNTALYENRAASSSEMLAQTNFHALHDKAIAENHICHNGLKEEAISILAGVCYITGFNESAIGVQITDLANLLHRYARRSTHEMSLIQLLEIYDKVLPLPEDATEIVRAYLTHPWQFVKIASLYYSKKRGWTPAAIMGRMSNLLEKQELYDAYIMQ